MLKPDSLRRALTDAVTVLKTSPEMLRIFVDNGSIASTLATSLSFEKRYTLNVIVTDFTGDFDLLIVPVLAWLRENQPDIMTTDEGQKKGFTFYADINNDSSFDTHQRPETTKAEGKTETQKERKTPARTGAPESKTGHAEESAKSTGSARR